MEISPKLVVNTYDRVEVIEDNHLPVGTKQRGVLPYMRNLIRENPLVKEVVYTGGFNGYGPVVAAFAAQECGLKCHLLLTTSRVGNGTKFSFQRLEKETTVIKARYYGAEITFINSWKKLVDRGKRITADPTVFWLPLGLEHPTFTRALSHAISIAGKDHDFKHIVVAGGVGQIAKAIKIAFPDCKVTAVAVSSVDKLRNKLSGTGVEVVGRLTSGNGNPPVPTIIGYDSYAYYVAKHLGATWWNVAGDNSETDINIPAVPSAVKSEEMRAAVHRVMLRNTYDSLSCQIPEKDYPTLARLVPDIFARLLFRSHIDHKTGDPALLNARDWDKDAIKTQLKYRLPDVEFVVPEFGEISPKCPSTICCATFEDIPPHLVQLLRNKYKGDDFETDAVRIYLRYTTVGALGHQMAMPLSVKQYLVDTFAEGDPENVIELFASAFNAGLPKYMSMFPDIEEYMGSIGTFGDGFVRPGVNVYIANPPYDEKMLTKMVDLFLNEVSRSQNFTVLFGMPEWKDFSPLEKLRASSFKRIEVVLKNREVPWMNIMSDEPEKTAKIPSHSWFVLSTKSWPSTIGDDMVKIWRSRNHIQQML